MLQNKIYALDGKEIVGSGFPHFTILWVPGMTNVKAKRYTKHFFSNRRGVSDKMGNSQVPSLPTCPNSSGGGEKPVGRSQSRILDFLVVDSRKPLSENSEIGEYEEENLANLVANTRSIS